MNSFIIVVATSLLLLSLLSNYIYLWLFRVQRIHTINAVISISYVSIVLSILALGRSTYFVAPHAARIGNVLLGLGYYLLVCAIFGAIVYSLFILCKFTQHRRSYAIGLLIIACVLTIAGHLYAQVITTRYHALSLSDNPTQSQTIALISDTHFGPARNTKLANRLANKLTDISPDMILYAGDMYDGPAFDFATINSTLRKLSDIAPVYFTPGNHEGYGPYNEFISNNTLVGFTNLIDSTATQSGITILGIDYRLNNQSHQLQALLQSLKSRSPELFEQPIIAIHHSPIMLDVLSQNGIDISVHGHTHRGQFWPNSFITRMVYGIYHYGINQYNGMDVVTTSGVGTAGPAMRLFNTPEIVVLTIQY